MVQPFSSCKCIAFWHAGIKLITTRAQRLPATLRAPLQRYATACCACRPTSIDCLSTYFSPPPPPAATRASKVSVCTTVAPNTQSQMSKKRLLLTKTAGLRLIPRVSTDCSLSLAPSGKRGAMLTSIFPQIFKCQHVLLPNIHVVFMASELCML